MNRYEEKLASARKWLASDDISNETKCVIEDIFQELVESDDEKTRKEIMNFVHDAYIHDEVSISKVEVHDKWLAWLENQKAIDVLDEEDMAFAKDVESWRKSMDDAYQNGYDACNKIWSEKQCEQKITEEYNGEDYGIDALWHAQRILERTLGEVAGYQSDDGILEHKCAITAVKKLYEQNPVWSEEDYNNIEYIAVHLDNTDNEDLADTLREIRDKHHSSYLQPKQEWGEEDEKTIDEAVKNLEKYVEYVQGGNSKQYILDLASRVESLRPQKQWKPSEGQLECLGYAIEKAKEDYSPLTNNRIYLTLNGLKEQLKQL